MPGRAGGQVHGPMMAAGLARSMSAVRISVRVGADKPMVMSSDALGPPGGDALGAPHSSGLRPAGAWRGQELVAQHVLQPCFALIEAPGVLARQGGVRGR